MLDKITYINSRGDILPLGTNGILIDANDLRDYEWSYDVVNGKASTFQHETGKKKVKCLIYGDDCDAKANAMHEVFEYDIAHSTAGKFVIGDYYLRAYVYASDKSDYLKDGILETKLSIIADDNVWVNDKTLKFRYAEESESEYLDFPYDMPYDFSPTGHSNYAENDSIFPSEFIMTIYGKSGMTGINVNIGGNPYILVADIDANEYIVINSREKTIIKTDTSGNKTNLFSARSRAYNIFEKVPSGRNVVTWDGVYDFDLELFQERSEPLWS